MPSLWSKPTRKVAVLCRYVRRGKIIIIGLLVKCNWCHLKQDVPVEALAENERISPVDVKKNKSNLILVDVRSKGEFGMCSIEDSLNFPFGNLEHSIDKLKENVLLARETKPDVKGY